MNSKNQEEVMKRRAKLSSSLVNVFQKVVLVAGVITLFLAIIISPTMAPLLAAAVAGGTLLLFFLLKSPKPKKEEPESNESAVVLPPVEEAAPEEHEILLREEDIVTPDAPGIVLEAKEETEVQQPPGDKQEEAAQGETINPQVPVSAGKEQLKEAKEFSWKGPLVHIQERLVKIEGKAINLEEMVLKLGERIDILQKEHLRKEPKIDLQTMLSDMEENPEKTFQ